jgi:hypothetical protein
VNLSPWGNYTIPHPNPIVKRFGKIFSKKYLCILVNKYAEGICSRKIGWLPSTTGRQAKESPKNRTLNWKGEKMNL